MKKALLILLLVFIYFLYRRLHPSPTSCHLSPCHGLDLSCTTATDKICTLDYQLGDRCRQFASCQSQIGLCHLVLDSKFSACKSCVQNCQQQYSQNLTELNQCETICTD